MRGLWFDIPSQEPCWKYSGQKQDNRGTKGLSRAEENIGTLFPSPLAEGSGYKPNRRALGPKSERLPRSAA